MNFTQKNYCSSSYFLKSKNYPFVSFNLFAIFVNLLKYFNILLDSTLIPNLFYQRQCFKQTDTIFKSHHVRFAFQWEEEIIHSDKGYMINNTMFKKSSYSKNLYFYYYKISAKILFSPLPKNWQGLNPININTQVWIFFREREGFFWKTRKNSGKIFWCS